MGQKANPIGNRLGIIKGWDSNWFGGNNYSDKLVEDEKIRKYLSARIAKGGVAKVVIERTLKRITVTIHTARPGIVIGKAGAEVDKIKEELKKLTKKEIQINIFEIKRPELDAQLVAEGVAKQLEARISFRRAMKSSIASTMRMGAEGIKIMTSGRLGGAEMARTEQYKEGRVPLHTFRADIDYALAEALTTYGKIGVKVWICKGEVYGKRDLSPNIGSTNNGPKGQSEKPAFGGRDNRGGGRDNRGGNDRRGGNQGGGRGPGQGGANRGGGAGANRGPRK
ncbi:30S ribosomal protein S3 [Pedobacter sandarakinus]|uniref:30S ribosomal protein S3 n=1 Tax=Pedobacter sandarakinus TaxID=353156 RepID=UPI002245E3E1|nr:30S ribosomal protein S3 [Pedobacter sandarakinus]MCX2576171.1 30S ribosomal protein S3 [Pedobacter sandarakinus]